MRNQIWSDAVVDSSRGISPNSDTARSSFWKEFDADFVSVPTNLSDNQLAASKRWHGNILDRCMNTLSSIGQLGPRLLWRFQMYRAVLINKNEVTTTDIPQAMTKYIYPLKVRYLIIIFTRACIFGADTPEIILNGIFSAGARNHVALTHVSEKTTAWLTEGKRFGRYRVESIIPQTETVILINEANRSEIRLTLQKSLVTGGFAEPAAYSKYWILSSRNPMLQKPLALPIEIVGRWMTLSESEREAIKEFYLKHGWNIAEVKVDQGLRVKWENIYENDRAEWVKANSKLFREMLSPQQRSDYMQINSINGLGAQRDADSSRKIKERSDRFFSYLTQEQKDAYKRITTIDFAAESK